MKRRRDESTGSEGGERGQTAEIPAGGSGPRARDPRASTDEQDEKRVDLRVRTLRQENDESGGH